MENFIIWNELIHLSMSLLTLTLLEIILGIDNLVFIAILSSRLPKHEQDRAQKFGLTLAWVTRLLLLGFAVFLTELKSTLFSLYGWDCSARDLFMLLGGVFLVMKATHEIHIEMDSAEIKEHKPDSTTASKFTATIIQIGLIDIVFSLDSILTAVGLTQDYWVMATAISIAIVLMIIASKPLSTFINQNPTVKMLALSFLILIGTILMADGFHAHIARGYIYVSVAFATFVESLNIIRRNRRLKARKTSAV